jgi:hypothetical protein
MSLDVVGQHLEQEPGNADDTVLPVRRAADDQLSVNPTCRCGYGNGITTPTGKARSPSLVGKAVLQDAAFCFVPYGPLATVSVMVSVYNPA